MGGVQSLLKRRRVRRPTEKMKLPLWYCRHLTRVESTIKRKCRRVQSRSSSINVSIVVKQVIRLFKRAIGIQSKLIRIAH